MRNLNKNLDFWASEQFTYITWSLRSSFTLFKIKASIFWCISTRHTIDSDVLVCVDLMCRLNHTHTHQKRSPTFKCDTHKAARHIWQLPLTQTFISKATDKEYECCFVSNNGYELIFIELICDNSHERANRS